LLLFAAISGFVIAKTSNPEKRLLEAEQLPVSVGHKTKLQHRIWIWKWFEISFGSGLESRITRWMRVDGALITKWISAVIAGAINKRRFLGREMRSGRSGRSEGLLTLMPMLWIRSECNSIDVTLAAIIIDHRHPVSPPSLLSLSHCGLSVSPAALNHSFHHDLVHRNCIYACAW